MRQYLVLSGLLMGVTTALHRHQPGMEQADVALNSVKIDADSGSPDGGFLVAAIGTYPDYVGTAPAGTIAVTQTADGIAIQGVLTGLAGSATGGFHIHTGYTCSVAAEVGGHYFDGMPSDPWSTTYTSDANGVAVMDMTMVGFSLWDAMPVAGRAIVIHDATGTRIGCGLLNFSPGQVAHLQDYPGYSGSLAVKGTIVATETTTGIQLTGTLAGLPASTTAGFHIHSGFTCVNAAGVGGHYFDVSDPWTTTYTSDSSGTAQISMEVADFSLYSSMPVLGRTVVVHSSSAKIGCGVLGEAETLVAHIGTYPTYTGAAPSGTVAVLPALGGIQIQGVLTGLPASTTAGFHVHFGSTCLDVTDIGSHYFDTGMHSDPWAATTYTSDANGVATIMLHVGGVTMSNAFAVAGRVIIVHDAAGQGIGCGLLEVNAGQVTHFVPYPGYSGSNVVTGTVITTQTSDGILMRGTVSGLPVSTTAGFHIHSGYSCDAAAGVGGHYYEGMSSDPWTTTYTSDASGTAQISQAMPGFSVYANMPVMGRAIVFHSTSSKIACGLIGQPEALMASISTYPGYTGPAPKGTVVVSRTIAGIDLIGALTGLSGMATGGIHIHSGFSCSAAADVGGHYYDGMPSDPWTTTTYTSNDKGASIVDMEVAGFGISDAMPVAGRAVVVHDAAGTRIGCGLLKVTTGYISHIGRYPGYDGDHEVAGTIVTEDAAAGIKMTGTLIGLPMSTTAGFHIHSGISCQVPAGVGGHYFEGLSSDPWTTTYTSDGFGTAQISLPMADFSLYSSHPVLKRTIVVHGSSTRIACGFPGTMLTKTQPPGPATDKLPMYYLIIVMGIISTIFVGRTFFS